MADDELHVFNHLHVVDREMEDDVSQIFAGAAGVTEKREAFHFARLRLLERLDDIR